FGDDWDTVDGTAVRDYIHVRDLADAHLLALEANVSGEHRIFNLGSGDGYSVKQVIETCREVTGHPIPAEVAPRRAGDPATLIASSQQFKSVLGRMRTRTALLSIVSDAWSVCTPRGDGAHSAQRPKYAHSCCCTIVLRCVCSAGLRSACMRRSVSIVYSYR